MFTPFAFLAPTEIQAAIIAAIQSRILITGGFTQYASLYDDRFVRIDFTGSAERLLFNQGTAGFSSTVNTFTTSSTGQWYVGGAFTSYSGSTVPKLVRLNTDGTLDTTFNTNIGTGPNLFNIFGIAVQSDDKPVIVGGFSTWNGTSINDVIRLNTNGTLDTTFNPGLGLNSLANGMVKDTLSNKMYVYGNSTTYSGSNASQIVRINTDGTYDTTFNVGTGFNSNVAYVYPQLDGKLLVGGQFTTYSGSVARRICRLNTDGTLDTTYTGWSNDGGINWIDVQPDGKIVYAGSFQSYSGSSITRIARSEVDGRRDTSFSVGTGFNNITQTVTSLPGNKNLVSGFFTTYNSSTYNRIVLLDTSGSVDSTFIITNPTAINGTGTGFNTQPTFAKRSGSFVYFGGDQLRYKVPTYNYILQTNNSGSIDSRFNMGANGANNLVYAAATQSNNDIVLVGAFTAYNGVNSTRVIKSNSSGTPYALNVFNTGTGANGSVYDVKIQSDDKIVICGPFQLYSGSTSNGIQRINNDGTKDTSFRSSGANQLNGPYAIFIQPDQKILMTGNYTAYSGSTSNYFVRINTDGTFDSTFNIGTGFNQPTYAAAIQPDGKIIVAGGFTSYSGSSGTNRTRLLRLNSDGTFDSTFASGTGFNDAPRSIKLQADGKLIAIGPFTTYSGSSYNRIIRINTNGSIDTSFNIGTGFDNSNIGGFSNMLEIDPSGSIYVASTFTSYSGSSNFKNFIKLRNSGSIDPIFNTSDGTGAANSTGLNSDGYCVIHYYA